jgi:hypothetical protein
VKAKEIREIVQDLESAIARLPDKPTSGFPKKLVGTYYEAVAELKQKIANLERAREPDSYFDPSQPQLFGIFAALAMVGQVRIPMRTLAGGRFFGSGVYAIYYKGDFDAYAALADSEHPIYVGKSKPKLPNARDAREQGESLWGRLDDHAKSIRCAANLRIEDFDCRYLVVHTGWEPAAESALIRLFKPIWNKETKVCSGIGKHGDDAETRQNGKAPWDTLHPGRSWADKTKTVQFAEPIIRQRISDHFAENPAICDTGEILKRFMGEIRTSKT